MDADVAALGRRAVAARGWRWLPGMLAMSCDGPMQPVRLTGQPRPHWPDEYDWPHDLGLRTPDLSDTETLARLLDLVRSMHNDADQVGVYRAFHSGEPYVRVDHGGAMAYLRGRTVAEALVVALEAAAKAKAEPPVTA
jgi:hypothetical protein